MRRALTPAAAPLAFEAAIRALIVSAVIAATGALLGDLQVVGGAYFGAGCAATFATGAVYRGRLAALLAQGLGAVVGIATGCLLPHTPAVLIATAAIAGVVSGLVGAMSPTAPAFGLMLSIGVAWGQFGDSALPWWQQCLWYLVGTAMIGVVALLPWVFRRGDVERQAAADVFVRSAELCEAIGTEGARAARLRTAAASAAARQAGLFPAAELTAFAVAGFYAEGRKVEPAVITAIQTAADQTRSGEPIDVELAMPAEELAADPHLQALADALSPRPSRPGAPQSRRLAAAARTLTQSTSLANGVRVGVCLALATAVAVTLKRPGEHALWLPLTTAVVLRPEYGSVFVRTVNRVSGTVAGALIAAVVLWLHPPGLGLAAAAAIGLACAVLTAPRLYAWCVTGITASTLLSASLGHTALMLPGVRVADTLLGATVAVVFGYLLWPGARRLPSSVRLAAALHAAGAYLTEAVKPPGLRAHWQIRRDDAYRLAHQVRAAAEVAITEPPPVSAAALAVVPLATRLEDIVDAITALATRTEAGVDCTASAAAVQAELAQLRSDARGLAHAAAQADAAA